MSPQHPLHGDRRTTFTLAVATVAVMAVGELNSAAAQPADIAFVQGALAAFGTADFDPADGSAGGSDTATGAFPVNPQSRSYTASGGTSTGPVRSTARVDMTIAAATRGAGGPVVLRVLAAGSASKDATPPGDGFANVTLNNDGDGGGDFVVDITGPAAIPYAITGTGVSFRSRGTFANLPANGTLAPGQYTLNMNVFASVSSFGGEPPSVSATNFDWRLALIVPEPTTPALAAAGTLLLARRRRAGAA